MDNLRTMVSDRTNDPQKYTLMRLPVVNFIGKSSRMQLLARRRRCVVCAYTCVYVYTDYTSRIGLLQISIWPEIPPRHGNLLSLRTHRGGALS